MSSIVLRTRLYRGRGELLVGVCLHSLIVSSKKVQHRIQVSQLSGVPGHAIEGETPGLSPGPLNTNLVGSVAVEALTGVLAPGLGPLGPGTEKCGRGIVTVDVKRPRQTEVSKCGLSATVL